MTNETGNRAEAEIPHDLLIDRPDSTGLWRLRRTPPEQPAVLDCTAPTGHAGCDGSGDVIEVLRCPGACGSAVDVGRFAAHRNVLLGSRPC
jgi:hypothetical protein